MSRAERTARIILIVLVIATYYGLGAGAMQSFVTYPAWRRVDAAHWHEYRAAVEVAVLVLVVPLLLMLLPAGLLVWKPPRAVPRWSAFLAFAAHFFVMAFSFAYIVPHFQIPLEQSPDPQLIDALIAVDRGVRLPAMALSTIVTTVNFVRTILDKGVGGAAPSAFAG